MATNTASLSAFDERLISIRRHLHMNPEVGLKEYQTSAYNREVLQSEGIEVQGPIAGTGLYADFGDESKGPTIAFRADIDALPIRDGKTVEYASRNAGVAHLCGHDAHTTIAIGTAVLLHQNRDSLSGRVRVIFQPNEESAPSGGRMMVDAGVIDGVDAIYAVHMDPTLASGRYGLISGAATAAADVFRVQVASGRTGHSARPHAAVDTVWASVRIASAYYQLIGRISDPREASVITICRFHGGEAYNVIPDEVTFGGTLRSTGMRQRSIIMKHMVDTASQIAASCGATARVTFDQSVPSVVNDARLIANVEDTVRDMLGSTALYQIPKPSMGGEDFGHYLQHVPGALIRVGSQSGPETAHPLHDARFDIDEKCLRPTSELMFEVLKRHLEASSVADDGP